MRKILIIASDNDPNVNVVAWALRSKGYDVDYLDTKLAFTRDRVNIEISRNIRSIFIGGTNVESYDSIWLRRVGSPVASELLAADSKKHVLGETKTLADNFLYLLEKNFTHRWFNIPTYTFAAENKLRQLDACRELGIPFPETIVSNTPSEIRKFVELHKEVVVKPFDPFSWDLPDGGRLMCFANSVDLDGISKVTDQELKICPAIYQRKIDKVADVRVVGVGQATFSCLIKTKSLALDFRLHQGNQEEITYEYYDLPEAYKRRLVGLMANFKVQFVSSDFAMDKDGNLHFLDLNPGGAYLFVEAYGGGKNHIVSHICSKLSGEQASKFPGLREYNMAAHDNNTYGYR